MMVLILMLPTLSLSFITLALHLAGAMAAAVLVVASFVAMYRGVGRLYRPVAEWMAWSAGFQVFTGSVLTAQHLQETTAMQFCGRIAVYISVIGVAEVMLYFRMKNAAGVSFPASKVALPFAGSAASAATVFAMLLVQVGS